MKKVFLFCVLSFMVYTDINSQTGQSEIARIQLPAESGEKIRLFTDRGIYCVNENIYFTAEYSCINELDSLEWSKVLYVELIKWNGIKLVQMKLKLTRPGTSGSLEIPGNIISGNYYLRAYTKWMRNFSARDYAYLLVKIVNPFRSETDAGPFEISIPSGSVTNNIARKNMIDGVICTMDKDEYKPREWAEVKLNISDKKFSDPYNYCISVAQVGVIDTTDQSYKPESASPNRSLSGVEYLPEIRGITISGEVVDRSTKLAMKNVLVSLSETQYGECFSVHQTNDLGRFVFSLPDMQGNRDFFIQTDAQAEILIDNDYCNQSVKLPFIAFNLNEDEMHRVMDMFINLQLNERFMSYHKAAADSLTGKAEQVVFYGSKKTVYYTEKYIELPNIEEFLNEIILEAEIINKKGNAFLTIKRRTGFSDASPLILFDNIQVDNDDRLLKTPLNKIERVEVVDRGYIVGTMNYGGIISIYSKNKDFAGRDLNKNSMFFTYGLYSVMDPISDLNWNSNNSRIPDRRNLLYWNPDIHLYADKEKTFSFYTSDSKGDYIIYVRRKNSKDDSEIYGKCYFSVR